MSYTVGEAIKEITELEYNAGVYSVKAGDISIWRLIRKKYVSKILRRKYHIGSFNERVLNIKPWLFLKEYVQSFISLLGLVIKNKPVDYIFFAMSRLQKVDNAFLDKFTDPIIKNSALENFLILQRPLAGKHFSPRYNNSHVIKLDFIHYSAKIFGIFLAPFVLIFYILPLSCLRNLYSVYFGKEKFLFWVAAIKIGVFLVEVSLYNFLYKRLKVKKIFVVNREINLAAIFAAKKQEIISSELQHGITLGPVLLYSTLYDPFLDPDYFLTFGKFWVGDQFGMPSEKLINIGFAFADFIWEIKKDNYVSENNCCLIISQPRIGSRIIENTLELAKENQNVTFHIRLHPQERLRDSLDSEISRRENVMVVPNTHESSTALLQYPHIIGVNSSVLYEALSLGKKVGCFNYNGCEAIAAWHYLDGGPFFILNSPLDFGSFLAKENHPNNSIKENSFYSKFDAEFIHKLA